jgi:hypothetical protein
MANIDKLSVNNEMAMLDGKRREFYDELTDEEKKKFSTYLMIRYGSSVHGSPELQAYYLTATNLRLNRNYFAITKKHDKLNWLAATTISPGMGNQRHQWIGLKKKEGSSSKVNKFLQKLYPEMKQSDLDLLASINDVKAWKDLAKEMGWTPEQIKKDLG